MPQKSLTSQYKEERVPTSVLFDRSTRGNIPRKKQIPNKPNWGYQQICSQPQKQNIFHQNITLGDYYRQTRISRTSYSNRLKRQAIYGIWVSQIIYITQMIYIYLPFWTKIQSHNPMDQDRTLSSVRIQYPYLQITASKKTNTSPHQGTE